jgi:hypothetical protein
MNRGTTLFVALAGALTCGLLMFWIWVGWLSSPNTIRLKATATVLVDGVPRTGSSVQEFRMEWVSQPHIGRTGAWRIVARGEAIRVDVPGEEPVYVLMSVSNDSGNYGALVEAACTVRGQGRDVQLESFMNMSECSLERFPKAVRFDGSGHDTAIAVFTAGESRNGYDFLSMAFERSDEPVTRGNIPPELYASGRYPTKVPFGRFRVVAGNLEFSSERFW